MSGPAGAGIIGRTLRLMLGLLLGWMTYILVRGEHLVFHLRAAAVLAGATAFYMIAFLVVQRYAAQLNRWIGALVVLIPIALAFAYGRADVRIGCAAYVGLSMFLQTIRADDGSEVLSIPAALARRRNPLPGILFTPIDVVEKHLTGPGGLPG